MLPPGDIEKEVHRLSKEGKCTLDSTHDPHASKPLPKVPQISCKAEFNARPSSQTVSGDPDTVNQKPSHLCWFFDYFSAKLI